MKDEMSFEEFLTNKLIFFHGKPTSDTHYYSKQSIFIFLKHVRRIFKVQTVCDDTTDLSYSPFWFFTSTVKLF